MLPKLSSKNHPELSQNPRHRDSDRNSDRPLPSSTLISYRSKISKGQLKRWKNDPDEPFGVPFPTQVPPLVARLPSSCTANDRQCGIASWAIQIVALWTTKKVVILHRDSGSNDTC
ncbi:hypothetical protein ANTRET_LOCUS2567 [Anthophora retusa]